MATHIARAAVDSWVTSAFPNENKGEGKWLRVRAGTTEYAFWRAKNPAPRGATVINATLHFFGVGSSGATYTVDLQRVADPWVESAINYTNRPAVTGSTVSVTGTESADATDWPFDVSAIVQSWCNGSPNYGVRLATSDTTERKFYAYNAVDNQPYLEVEYADVPDAPTELSPGGGSAVSIAKPILLFNFHDPLGSDMAALQVQIKATNSGWTAIGGFASPDFDSTTVASSDPELDLSTTAYAGISLAATEFWTVRVRNAALNWSDWSDPTSFTRTAKGTLTLSSPSGGTITDPTPTLIWGLSGATQTSYRVTIWNDSDDTVNSVYDTGRITSTATSLTIPRVNRRGQRIISDEGATYRFRVRVHDILTRASTPGDTSYTETVVTVTYADGVPAAPTSVTAAQVASGKPHVKLDIVIGSAPDDFVIVRNGKIIDLADPVDIFLSGTTYRYIDRTAAPNNDYVYKVRSRISGDTGPARTATPNPFTYTVGEVWLLDWSTPGSTRLVPVVTSLDDDAFEMPETSGTYSPVNGDSLINITQGQQGLSGHISGRIVARAGLTSAASVADMLWFKKRPANVIRMTLGGQNLRVRLRNIVLRPLATGDTDARGVEFDFYSLDGPTQ